MSVSAVGAKLWNELDSNLRNTKTILLFKKKIKMGCTYHMIEYLHVEKHCSTLNIMVIINLLNDDCNLEGFSFEHL